MGKRAIIIGATGLVGKEVLLQTLEDHRFSQVLIFVRRSTGIVDDKLTEHIIDFENSDASRNLVTGDVLFSCLGTTLQQAGSKEKQYRVDYSFQYEFAKYASENKVPDYVLVSSTGANARSSFFYPRMKGELEEAVKKLDFARIIIVQPSVLAGDREHPRTGEKVAGAVIDFLGKVLPFLKRYRSITGNEVAQAVIRFFHREEKHRVQVYKLDELTKR